MRHLILLRHAETQQDPSTPASQWELTPTGLASCDLLADRLAVFSPAAIWTSPELKAVQTAEAVSAHLGLPIHIVEGLHEHERTGVGFMDKAGFEEKVRQFFEQPDELVFGTETASQALARFSSAVMKVIDSTPSGDVMIASHGTVISLFYSAQGAQIGTFEFWRNLGMPAYIVFTLPGLTCCEAVTHV